MEEDKPLALPRSLTYFFGLYISTAAILTLQMFRTPSQQLLILALAALLVVSFVSSFIRWWRHHAAIWVTEHGIATAGLFRDRAINWEMTDPLVIISKPTWMPPRYDRRHLRLNENRSWPLEHVSATPTELLAFIDNANQLRARKISARPTIPAHPRRAADLP